MALIGKHAEKIARRFVPVSLAPGMKLVGSYPRYLSQRFHCREGFRKFGSAYAQNILFIAGMPKSGTTWLEKMLTGFPGYHTIMIPEAVRFEMRNGGSHDFDLPPDLFGRMEKMLAVMKLHLHGSGHNVNLLRKAALKYVVMYRDPRDVAVSHYFYVRKTPWHPEHAAYSAMDIKDGLLHFGRTLLPAFADWLRSWRENSDSEFCLELRYEDMLSDAEREFKRVVKHFGLNSSQERIRNIVESHSFQKLSGGRKRGEQHSGSFFRKGIAGDWKTYFTNEINDLYKARAGNVFVDFGYEENGSW
jgi:hypothetical protein